MGRTVAYPPLDRTALPAWLAAVRRDFGDAFALTRALVPQAVLVGLIPPALGPEWRGAKALKQGLWPLRGRSIGRWRLDWRQDAVEDGGRLWWRAVPLP